MPRYKEYNKVRLIQKATRQFWEHGYGATSMATLTDILGVNKFSFYDAFESKENLLVETIRYHFQSRILPLIAELERSGDIRKYLHALLQSDSFGFRGCYILTITSETGNSVPGAIELLKTYIDALSVTLDEVAKKEMPQANEANRKVYSRQLLALCTSIPLMYPVKPGRSNMGFVDEFLSVAHSK